MDKKILIGSSGNWENRKLLICFEVITNWEYVFKCIPWLVENLKNSPLCNRFECVRTKRCGRKLIAHNICVGRIHYSNGTIRQQITLRKNHGTRMNGAEHLAGFMNGKNDAEIRNWPLSLSFSLSLSFFLFLSHSLGERSMRIEIFTSLSLSFCWLALSFIFEAVVLKICTFADRLFVIWVQGYKFLQVSCNCILHEILARFYVGD